MAPLARHPESTAGPGGRRKRVAPIPPMPGTGVNGAVDSGGEGELPMGLPGLERTIRTLESTLPEMPLKERLAGMTQLGRLMQNHEKMRVEASTARQEYFASSDFAADCRALLAAFPGSARQFRDALSRIGVSLPELVSTELAPSVPAPTTAEDVDDLARELKVARELHDAGEVQLAWAHTLRLELDVHTEVIARLLVDEFDTDAIFGFLESLCFEPDRVKLQAAVELRFALDSLRGCKPDIRALVAELVTCLNRSDIAAEMLVK